MPIVLSPRLLKTVGTTGAVLATGQAGPLPLDAVKSNGNRAWTGLIFPSWDPLPSPRRVTCGHDRFTT
jgi:hypothetical protein